MRRVVITGIGLLTPLGMGVETSWKHILAGTSGAGRITAFDPTDYGCQIACEVPRGSMAAAAAVPTWRDRSTRRKPSPTKSAGRVDDFILYAIAAADEAVKDAGWTPEDDHERERTGVVIGSGIGGLQHHRRYGCGAGKEGAPAASAPSLFPRP